jgi:4-amino-4-deoxy-L-arabinose transferase-like glycosyltransferase
MTVPADAATARRPAERPRPPLSRRIASKLPPAIRRLPPALAGILLIVAIVGVSWALFLPPWQSADESLHFAYAQSLAERFALPQDSSRDGTSTDQEKADLWSRASVIAHFSDELRADWDPHDVASYRKAFAKRPSRSDGGGPTSASANPPLYYLYADLAYWAAYPASAFGRLYAMRVWTVALLLVTVVGAWLLAGEVLGRRRLAQLACAASVGLIPMLTSISASVNPDALLVALSTMALWLGARVIIRAARPRDVVALCAVTAAAILTKATAYALVPAVLLALFVGWRRCTPAERRRWRAPFATALTLSAAPVIGWVAYQTLRGRAPINTVGGAAAGVRTTPFNIWEFLSYLWQFYLPRLPWMRGFRTTTGLPVYSVWVREGWGAFGWLDVYMPSWIYGLLASLTGLVAAGSAAVVARFRDRTRWLLAAFFALGLLAMLVGLHETDYRSIITNNITLLQGRYLLPFAGLFGLAVGLLVSRIPARLRAPACGAVVAAMLLLQILALATVAQRYYA